MVEGHTGTGASKETGIDRGYTLNQAETFQPAPRRSPKAEPSTLLDRFARRLLLGRLEAIGGALLTISDGDNRHRLGDQSSALVANITVNDPRFYSTVAFGGAVAAAEAYMQNYWDCDDLTRVVRILVRNRPVLENMESNARFLLAPIRKLLHFLNRNTRSGSKRNIAAHYDLSNDFFRLWLDETMMYSSAVFSREGMALEEAAAEKLDRICRKLQLTADDHVLEIGTGWGGFAEFAASKYGCRVTTTTISDEQFEFAKARVHRAGLQDRVTLLRKDYRDLDGRYDKIVSIEMIEAVGHEYLRRFFDVCSSHLKDDGMMVLQAITIPDQRYASALKSVDFIQRYIFPGGFLPSVTAMLEAATAVTDLRLYHLEDIGEHYAHTLACWRSRFFDQAGKIRSMGFSEEFIRMWNYYFCYCEGAFTERAIGNVQMLFVKPGNRRTPITPDLGPAITRS
ncbi:MAG: cyclopropane-fatty-acyl-phospholipid synthase family protein [Gammaproteobacteria bacterium]|nr:cyclopropane-fatty-acyl-phospholipid synthase family protein [Gammaproteobacteria bacterium]